MKSLTTNILGEVQKAHGGAAWRWLVTLRVSESVAMTEEFSLTNHPSALTYNSVSFKPYPLQVGVQSTDDAGSLPTVELTLSNITRDIAPYLQKADNLMGKTVTLRLVNVDHLTAESDTIGTDFTIAGAVVTRASIGMQLQLPDLHSLQFPEETFLRDRCRRIFGSPQCGYVITAEAGVFTECDKTLVDCIARGDEEVTRGRPRLHPRMFGGFPGLPRKVRA